MTMKNVYKKIVIMIVFIMSISSFTMIGYSYWNNLSSNQDGTLSIGDWGTPISTPQEFYDFATKPDSSSSDRYYLFNNIDFTNFTWNLDNTNSNVTFKGTLDGNGKTISNLTISTNSNSYDYIGIFSHIKGGSVYNLTLDNVQITLSGSAYNSSSIVAGLIAGDANGLTSTISDITIQDCIVAGTGGGGVGGLIGKIDNSSAVVNIENIKASNLSVGNMSSNVGGLIGKITKVGAQVNISDIDISVNVYSNKRASYAGGVIGNIRSGGVFNLERAIVDISLRNYALAGYYTSYDYSQRYSGGIIGYNRSTSTLVNLSDVFLTGSLYSDANHSEKYVATAIGRESGSDTITNGYYSQVVFRSSNGGTTYTPYSSISGVQLAVVNSSSMPSLNWWNSFATPFDSTNNLWAQDSSGRLYLIR